MHPDLVSGVCVCLCLYVRACVCEGVCYGFSPRVWDGAWKIYAFIARITVNVTLGAVLMEVTLFTRHSFTSKYQTAESHGPVLVRNFHLKGLQCEILKEGSNIGVFFSFYIHKHSCLSHVFLVPWKLHYHLARSMLLTPLWPINA